MPAYVGHSVETTMTDRCSTVMTHSAGRHQTAVLDRPLVKATACPEKLGQRRWDSHYTPSHFNSPFPKSSPQGDLHHSMSSAWSTHSTLHTGPREKSKCVCVCVLVLRVYSVTNTNTPTHSQPVDRVCGLHCKTSSKCLQNMGSFYCFTAALGSVWGIKRIMCNVVASPF